MTKSPCAYGIEAATLKQPNYVKASGVLSDIELVDATVAERKLRG
jgi:hypothetical protein